LAEVVVEYILGFAFGWTIFQTLFMRDMAGGSYRQALTGTFVAELLSMNLLLAGMVPTVTALKARIASAADPTTPSFWFVMSMPASLMPAGRRSSKATVRLSICLRTPSCKAFLDIA
jgi:hypothetical protein